MLGSFLPSRLVVKQPESTRVEGADIVMKSSADHWSEMGFEEMSVEH
jgi:hypothetical protein